MTDIKNYPRNIVISQGASQNVYIQCFDNRGEAEDYSSPNDPTEATAVFAESAIATPAFTLSIANGKIAVQPGGNAGVLGLTISGVNSALLSIGTNVMQTSVTISGETYVSDFVDVKVKRKLA